MVLVGFHIQTRHMYVDHSDDATCLESHLIQELIMNY